MTKTISRLRFGVVAVLMVAVLMSLVPLNASAATYYPNYAPQSREELINYLYALIAQLQQGATPAGGYNYGYDYGYGYQNQYQYQYQPRVLGSTYYGDYDVEVQTFSASNIDDDEAWIWGEIDLNGAPYATVWFEYGDDRDMDDETRRTRIDNRTSDTFRGDLDGLDEGERYYYRAVAEDPAGDRSYGQVLTFIADDRHYSRSSDDEPEAETLSARDIDDDSAELRGRVDMNDFDNGLVFFVYGEDEDQVDDVDREDEYGDIDEDGDDLQKFIVDRDLDDDANYYGDIFGLDDNTDYYFRICVEYEDEDDDETLECGDSENFETD